MAVLGFNLISYFRYFLLVPGSGMYFQIACVEVNPHGDNDENHC